MSKGIPVFNQPLLRIGLAPASLALMLCTAPARADVPHDLQTGMVLWLDGQDVNGTELTGGTQGATNPADLAPVPTWRDKSPKRFTAATATGFTVSSTPPSYRQFSGVYFDGVSNAMQITNGIFTAGSITKAVDVFVAASTPSIKSAYLMYAGAAAGSPTNSIAIKMADGSNGLYQHFGATTNSQTVSYTNPMMSGMNNNYGYLFTMQQDTASSALNIFQRSQVSYNGTATNYTQTGGHNLFLGKC